MQRVLKMESWLWKMALIILSLCLLTAITLLTVTVIHRPHSLWRLIAPRTPEPMLSTLQRFITLPPGAILPGESPCAARVRRSSWEPRSDNTTANQRVPTPQQVAQLASWGPDDGVDEKADSLRKEITGNFTGTTDEILQWVACKWGIDEDIVRAEAIVESTWHQNYLGDWTTDQSVCPPETWNGQGCYQSYGILQLKFYYFQSTWPMSRDDTAFSAEYVYAVIRTCYEGWTTYLFDRVPAPGYPRYHAGDIWGCLGRWFSGGWYDQGAIDYINQVKTQLAEKDWLMAGF